MGRSQGDSSADKQHTCIQPDPSSILAPTLCKEKINSHNLSSELHTHTHTHSLTHVLMHTHAYNTSIGEISKQLLGAAVLGKTSLLEQMPSEDHAPGWPLCRDNSRVPFPCMAFLSGIQLRSSGLASILPPLNISLS